MSSTQLTADRPFRPSLAGLGMLALVALPALLTAYLSFSAGGFYPATPALVALVLGQVMVLRTTSAERPYAGYSRALAIACVALALFALWGLSSSSWSHAPGRALMEFDRVLMYLLVLVVFGSVRWSDGQARWMVRLVALGVVGVCAVGLTSRVLPDVLTTSPNVANDRLSYPLTYWNSLGLVAALGVVLCLYLATDERGGAWVRALGAAGAPVAATTLYFTFSRGAIAACAIAIVVYVLVARPRGLLAGLPALGVGVGVALVTAYRASLLAGLDPTSAAATSQGHHVARVVGGCVVGAAALRLALVPLDRRFAALRLPTLSGRAVGALAAGAVLAAVALTFATGLSDRIGRDVDTFVHSNPAPSTDLRSHLVDFSNRARIDHWNVALDAFGRAPLRGTGLGTYENQWARYRAGAFSVVNAHSLYLETLSDLGIVGGLLLAVALGSVLLGFARRARGDGRPLYAALLACGVAWALASGVDWHWQMPATTVWLFALGGVALSARGPFDAPAPAGRQSWRLIAGVGWLALLVTPLVVTVSQSRQQVAINRFDAGDCPGATAKALDSIATLNVRPQPYEILGYCDLGDGNPAAAERALRKAAALDPASWELSYGLALARAANGSPPRLELAKAMRENPKEALIRTAAPGLMSSSPARRRASARAARRAVLDSGQLSIGAF